MSLRGRGWPLYMSRGKSCCMRVAEDESRRCSDITADPPCDRGVLQCQSKSAMGAVYRVSRERNVQRSVKVKEECYKGNKPPRIHIIELLTHAAYISHHTPNRYPMYPMHLLLFHCNPSYLTHPAAAWRASTQHEYGPPSAGSSTIAQTDRMLRRASAHEKSHRSARSEW